jgi:hypothetical protein
MNVFSPCVDTRVWPDTDSYDSFDNGDDDAAQKDKQKAAAKVRQLGATGKKRRRSSSGRDDVELEKEPSDQNLSTPAHREATAAEMHAEAVMCNNFLQNKEALDDAQRAALKARIDVMLGVSRDVGPPFMPVGTAPFGGAGPRSFGGGGPSVG